MPNGMIVFILTTSLDKHLATTQTYPVPQILDTNAEVQKSYFFSINCMFGYDYKIYTSLNKIVKSEILSDLSVFLYLTSCQIQ